MGRGVRRDGGDAGDGEAALLDLLDHFVGEERAGMSLAPEPCARAMPAMWSASSWAATMQRQRISGRRCSSGSSSRITRRLSKMARSQAGSRSSAWRSRSIRRERRDQHFVVERGGALLLYAGLGQLGRFLVVEGDQALVEARRRREDRLDAEQHVEEAELGDVAAHHRDADGQRGGHQQADRPPQPGPEQRCDDDGHRREAGAAPVEQAAPPG